MPINKNRIIEINKLGKFFVTGQPKFIVLEAPNTDPKFSGYIIAEERFSVIDIANNIQRLNVVFKLTEDNQVIARLLIKNLAMAEEICFACNRISV